MKKLKHRTWRGLNPLTTPSSVKSPLLCYIYIKRINYTEYIYKV